MPTFLDAAEWYATLATLYGTAAALITSPPGDVLLVKPNYRDHWSLPGGILEDGEPPHVGCAREVREELGLSVPMGPLLAVAWIASGIARVRPWSRTPAVMTQVFTILIALWLLEAHRYGWGIPALLFAIAALAGLFAPTSLRALTRPH